MKNLILLLSVLALSSGAQAGLGTDIGKVVNSVVSPCSAEKAAQVEAILNNTDSSKPMIVQEGENSPWRLFTKNNYDGLKKKCEEAADALGPWRYMEPKPRVSFICKNKAWTCNVQQLVAGGSDDDDDEEVVVVKPKKPKPKKPKPDPKPDPTPDDDDVNDDDVNDDNF